MITNLKSSQRHPSHASQYVNLKKKKPNKPKTEEQIL